MGLSSGLGNPNTVSENLFEQYLNGHGFTDLLHEAPVAGKSTTPDYCLNVDGKNVYFDVKEFEAPTGLPEVGFVDPYSHIREKINQARRQFKHYKEYVCAIVLANPLGAYVFLDHLDISGAMFGNVGFQVPLDLSIGEQPIQNVFMGQGKLLRSNLDRNTSSPQNTTISAVVVLDRYPISSRTIECKRRENYGENARNPNFFDELPPPEKHPLRVTVYENPYARRRFPENLFRGPYDERWDASGGFYKRTFAGEEIIKLDSELNSL